MKDVITGPGEYRMRDGSSATIVAIVKGKAIGYRMVAGEPYAGDWRAGTGSYIEGERSNSDILPPAPVIDGPGPYECRDGSSFHVSVVSNGVALGHREFLIGGFMADRRCAQTGRSDNFSKDRHEDGDVIRKRSEP